MRYEIKLDLRFPRYKFPTRLWFRDTYGSVEEAFIDLSLFKEATNDHIINKFNLPKNFTITSDKFSVYDMLDRVERIDDFIMRDVPHEETHVAAHYLIKSYPGYNVKGIYVSEIK